MDKKLFARLSSNLNWLDSVCKFAMSISLYVIFFLDPKQDLNEFDVKFARSFLVTSLRASMSLSSVEL